MKRLVIIGRRWHGVWHVESLGVPRHKYVNGQDLEGNLRLLQINSGLELIGRNGTARVT